MCRRLRDASRTLRASALLALCKLMCLDAAFCDTNLQLVFTLLQNRQGHVAYNHARWFLQHACLNMVEVILQRRLAGVQTGGTEFG